MNSLILLTALTAGQPPQNLPPIGGYPQYAPQTAATGPAYFPQPPAAQPAVPAQPGAMPPAANGNGNGNGCAKCEEEEEKKDEPEPWALMRVLKGTTFGCRLEERGIAISGWTQGSYTASTARVSNLPITFNDRADFWQLNQNFLRVDKAIDTEKDEFQLGWRTEWILPGTDARFTQSRGMFNGQTGLYQIDLIQAYVDAFMPNLGPKGSTVRVGKFATHCSYELMQGAETPFLSRAYTFQYNPFTHTGVYTISPLDDTWTVSNGLVLGSDNFIDSANRLTYIGQLKWAPEESKTNALFNVVVTDPRFDVAEAFPYYNAYNIVLTHNFTEKLTYVLDSTFSHIDGVPGTGSATWYGAANYLLFKHSDEVTSAFRAELFEDTKGFRTGFSGLYTGITYGLAVAPKPGLIFRPSLRFDHNNTSRPFEGKPDLFTAAMDMIIRW